MYDITVLNNGVTVVSENIPHLRSASVGFWIRCGSRHEPADVTGISHFIEHMLFKGTRTRTARQIAEEFDASGGSLNAFTGKEDTCLVARVPGDQLEFAVEVLADMLTRSVFPHQEIVREKGVILEEINMYEDSPEEIVHDLLTEAVLPGHPLASSVLGTREAVAKLTREDLLAYKQQHYVPRNLVVAAAGRVEHNELIAMVQQQLNGWRAEKAGCSSEQMNRPIGSRRTIVRSKDIEQVHICLATTAPSLGDEQRFPLQVLDVILGGGMSSRLFQRLREEKGLVYTTYSYYYGFSDAGIFGVYAAMNRSNLAPVLDLIRAEFQLLQTQDLSAEVTRAKQQLKGSLLLGLESTANRMNRLGRGVLYYGRPISPDEIIARIEAVTPAQVQEQADRLWQTQPSGVAVVGPVDEEEVDSSLSALNQVI